MVGLRQSSFKYWNYRVLHKHAKGAMQNCKNLLLLLMHLGKSWEAVNVVGRNLSYGKGHLSPCKKKKKSWKTRTVASRRNAWPVIDRHEMSTPIQDMYVGSQYRWSQAVWGMFQLTQILHQIGQLQICPVEFGFALCVSSTMLEFISLNFGVICLFWEMLQGIAMRNNNQASFVFPGIPSLTIQQILSLRCQS